MIRLIASDLDGTLLCDERNFHMDALALLRERAARGVAFVAVSGRSAASCRVLFDDAGFPLERCIGVNGAYLLETRTGEVKRLKCFAPGVGRRAAELMLAEDLNVCVYTPDRIVYSRPGAIAASRERDIFSRMGGYGVRAEEGPRALLRALDEPILKAFAERGPYASEAAYVRAREACAALEGVSITSSWRNNFEAMPCQTDKGSALLALAAELAIAPEEIAAFGDGDNDASMLRAAGVGVAMADGTAQAQAAADCVAQSVADWLRAHPDS